MEPPGKRENGRVKFSQAIKQNQTMTLKKPLKVFPLFLAGTLLFTGCNTMQVNPPPQMASISCKVPTIVKLDETKESQEKGGLEITIVPVLYKAVRTDKQTITSATPDMGEQLLILPQNKQGKYYVETTTTPRLQTEPSRLQFKVRINNKLSRVFRGQGSVVQVNIGGKLMPINQQDYAEFMNGIVPPRNEAEVNIYGPSLDSIADKGTIGIFLYDVVTAVNEAGQVTEKQNYEWYFSYTTKEELDQAVVTKTRGLMDATAYQEFKRQEAQDNARKSRP